jgi:hypothetical protein
MARLLSSAMLYRCGGLPPSLILPQSAHAYTAAMRAVPHARCLRITTASEAQSAAHATDATTLGAALRSATDVQTAWSLLCREVLGHTLVRESDSTKTNPAIHPSCEHLLPAVSAWRPPMLAPKPVDAPAVHTHRCPVEVYLAMMRALYLRASVAAVRGDALVLENVWPEHAPSRIEMRRPTRPTLWVHRQEVSISNPLTPPSPSPSPPREA